MNKHSFLKGCSGEREEKKSVFSNINLLCGHCGG